MCRSHQSAVTYTRSDGPLITRSYQYNCLKCGCKYLPSFRLEFDISDHFQKTFYESRHNWHIVTFTYRELHGHRYFYPTSSSPYFMPSNKVAYEVQLLHEFEAQMLRNKASFRGLASVYNDMTTMLNIDNDSMTSKSMDRKQLADSYFRCVYLKFPLPYFQHENKTKTYPIPLSHYPKNINL